MDMIDFQKIDLQIPNSLLCRSTGKSLRSNRLPVAILSLNPQIPLPTAFFKLGEIWGKFGGSDRTAIESQAVLNMAFARKIRVMTF